MMVTAIILSVYLITASSVRVAGLAFSRFVAEKHF